MYIDRFSLEDLIEFQDVSFEILQGYYFNEGFNTKIRASIQKIFDKRLEMKAAKNPVQLCINSLRTAAIGKVS